MWFKDCEKTITVRSTLAQIFMGINVTGAIPESTKYADGFGPSLEHPFYFSAEKTWVKKKKKMRGSQGTGK